MVWGCLNQIWAITFGSIPVLHFESSCQGNNTCQVLVLQVQMGYPWKELSKCSSEMLISGPWCTPVKSYGPNLILPFKTGGSQNLWKEHYLSKTPFPAKSKCNIKLSSILGNSRYYTSINQNFALSKVADAEGVFEFAAGPCAPPF